MADTDVVGWVTLGQARAAWPDGAKLTEPRLTSLLTTAYEMCVQYAPAPAPTAAEAPSRYKEAQILHARAIYTAARANGAGQVGLEGEPNYAADAPTLSGQIKQLLRPRAGLPSVL